MFLPSDPIHAGTACSTLGTKPWPRARPPKSCLRTWLATGPSRRPATTTRLKTPEAAKLPAAEEYPPLKAIEGSGREGVCPIHSGACAAAEMRAVIVGNIF